MHGYSSILAYHNGCSAWQLPTNCVLVIVDHGTLHAAVCHGDHVEAPHSRSSMSASALRTARPEGRGSTAALCLQHAAVWKAAAAKALAGVSALHIPLL
jgi:hypothetical protein